MNNIFKDVFCVMRLYCLTSRSLCTDAIRCGVTRYRYSIRPIRYMKHHLVPTPVLRMSTNVDSHALTFAFLLITEVFVFFAFLVFIISFVFCERKIVNLCFFFLIPLGHQGICFKLSKATFILCFLDCSCFRRWLIHPRLCIDSQSNKLLLFVFGVLIQAFIFSILI